MRGWRAIRNQALDAMAVAIMRNSWGFMRASIDTPSALYHDVGDELDAIMKSLWDARDGVAFAPPAETVSGPIARVRARGMATSAILLYLEFDRREIHGDASEQNAVAHEMAHLLNRLGQGWRPL